jgi:hypothetical protein
MAPIGPPSAVVHRTPAVADVRLRLLGRGAPRRWLDPSPRGGSGRPPAASPSSSAEIHQAGSRTPVDDPTGASSGGRPGGDPAASAGGSRPAGTRLVVGEAGTPPSATRAAHDELHDGDRDERDSDGDRAALRTEPRPPPSRVRLGRGAGRTATSTVARTAPSAGDLDGSRPRPRPGSRAAARASDPVGSRDAADPTAPSSVAYRSDGGRSRTRRTDGGTASPGVAGCGGLGVSSEGPALGVRPVSFGGSTGPS